MEKEPLYNLKAVVQQTGVKPDTLRAWERRYGLPMPQRSAGRHRLYSRHDIATIKWLAARQREGLSIKRAVELWRQIEGEGQDPLDSLPTMSVPSSPVLEPGAMGETLVQLREEWLAACLAYDGQRAEQVVSQAFALYSPETVCLELLQKAMAQIGDGWYRAEVTVQQEHFAAASATRRVEALIVAAPLPVRPGRILVACPPQEEHVFGLLVLTFLLRRRGWEVVYLGANVPVDRLEVTVAATHPRLVILAAQRLHTAATLLETGQLLEREGVPLAYGGMIFNLLPALRDRIPGHFMGEQLDSASQSVESLMTVPRVLPAPETIPELYLLARDHFLERKPLIEARLIRTPAETGVAPHHISMANRELALNIAAALSLGDMGFLGTDIKWVEGLLENHRVPVDHLRDYLTAYHQVAKDNLDERGEPIVSWLGGMIHERAGSGS